MTTKSFETIPVDVVINRFTHDSGIGVKDSINAIEAVIKDMLDDLKES